MGMEDVLRIDKILDFCDVPQLFVARDAFDTLYVFYMMMRRFIAIREYVSLHVDLNPS